MEKYDLFVIGTGSAGFAAAEECRKQGLRVAIADKLPFGGTCALRGCNPKRLMSGATEILNRASHMKGRGVEGSVIIDWPKLIDFTKDIIQAAQNHSETLPEQLGIEKYHGICRFTGENSLLVGDTEIQADRIVIATGSAPAHLGIPGEEHINTSDTFFELQDLPKRILFVGGGYISFELAHIAAWAGARVEIVEVRDTVLANFDQNLVKMFLDVCEKEGISVYTSSPIHSIERSGNEYRVHAGERKITTDLIIHGAGRVPETADLNLEKGNVKTGPRGIIANQFLQSESNPSVYIAGDVNPNSVQLTTVAEMEGDIVAHNLLYGNSKVPDYNPIASTVFSFPQLSSAGLTESQARQQGIDFDAQFINTSDRHITRRLGLTHSGFKVLTDRDTGAIIGAHLLGHNCDEVINVMLMAISARMTVGELKKMRFTFPTVMHDLCMRLG